MNEDKKLSKRVGLFVIILSTVDGVSLDFIDEKTREYLNNLYPELLNILGMKFSLDVEKEVNKKGEMPVNESTLNSISKILHKGIDKMPFTLRRLLLSPGI